MRKILKWSQFSSILEAQSTDIETDAEALEPVKAEYSRMAKDKLSWCLQQLMAKTPYWGEFATKLKFREDWNLPFKTMATNGYELIYDPEFVVKRKKSEVIWVIAHEIMHCVLNHHDRKQVDHMVWNAACDYALNQLIQPDAFADGRGNDLKVEIPEGCLGGPQDTNPYKDKFIGKSAEQIYQFLIDNNVQLPPEQGWNYGGVNPKPPKPPTPDREDGGGGGGKVDKMAKVGDFIVLPNGDYGKIVAIDGTIGECDIDPMTEDEVIEEIQKMAGRKIESIR
jgi:hypothetical protein